MARFKSDRQRRLVMARLMTHLRKAKAVEMKAAMQRQILLRNMKGVLG